MSGHREQNVFCFAWRSSFKKMDYRVARYVLRTARAPRNDDLLDDGAKSIA